VKLPPKKTTIKDVATMAGVSTSTVSRALNDTGRIDASTKTRIRELSDRLGYRPSAFARGLVMRKTKTILLIASDISNAYFAEITKCISKECRANGYKLLLGDTDENPDIENEYLDIIREGMVDAAIVACHPSDDNVGQYLDLARGNFPLVFVDSAMIFPNVSRVIVDNAAGAEMILDYLVSKGHTNIGFVAHGSNEDHATYERQEGFAQGLIKHGLEVRPDNIVILEHAMEHDALVGTGKLLEREDPPTAIFAFNDMVAIGCIASIKRHGLKVPEDVAVVGYDDVELGTLIDVPLTTVSIPKLEIAKRAVGVVLELIAQNSQEKNLVPEHILLKPTLVIRDSA